MTTSSEGPSIIPNFTAIQVVLFGTKKAHNLTITHTFYAIQAENIKKSNHRVWCLHAAFTAHEIWYKINIYSPSASLLVPWWPDHLLLPSID